MAALCGLALCSAPSASAALSCDYESATRALTVTSTGFEEVVAIRRKNGAVAVFDDQMGGQIWCTGPSALIGDADSIELTGSGVSPSVYFDLSKGGMTPGFENESPELDEIEISVTWADGFYGVGGGKNNDRYIFGDSIFGSAVKLNNDSDPDAFLGTTQNVLVRGEGDADVISGKGGGVFSGPLLLPMNIQGGAGKDKLTGGSRIDFIYGQGGKDKVSGGKGKDEIFVKGGSKDKVKCGPGKDLVHADSKDKIADDCEKVQS